MRDYAIQTWGNWHEEESRLDAERQTDSGNLEIISYEGADIGTLQTRLFDDYLEIEKIYILPRWQCKGLGTEILEQLISNATRNGKAIRLQVLRVNRAHKLYKRLGFIVLEENDERIFLEYPP